MFSTKCEQGTKIYDLYNPSKLCTCFYGFKKVFKFHNVFFKTVFLNRFSGVAYLYLRIFFVCCLFVSRGTNFFSWILLSFYKRNFCVQRTNDPVTYGTAMIFKCVNKGFFPLRAGGRVLLTASYPHSKTYLKTWV